MIELEKVGRGLNLAITGTKLALSTSKIQRYFYKSFLFLTTSIFLLYILFNSLLFSPLRILKFLNWIFSIFFSYNYETLNYTLDNWISSINIWLQGAPLSALFFIRFVYPYPLNNIFLVSLTSINEEFSNNLKTYPYYLQYWKELRLSLGRNFKRFALSQIPHIGWLAIPYASISVTSQNFGYPIAVGLASLPLFMPSTKYWVLNLIKTYYGIRALSRELLEPYLGRMCFRFRDKRRFLRDRESELLGFSIIFYILINISFIGPIFFVIAQSAISVLLSETTEIPPANPVKESDIKTGTEKKEGVLDLSEPSEFFGEPVAKLDIDVSKLPKY
ncbi:hypothetical protein CONCODRAFT_79682 [Conidiobolus coronatus NRRL 28638]|uniref:EI24-domain-containing protein n=1 Tax=Conidiobolus coronatus (strain ATCC 28846 / CBS 209.66 / NRRL 28638) TaxID=796925 RepID=A0A137P0K7_CONC2|nr:hypothetical protein CONCODRAFT_79682 [Conidiobolus coronatus NRRL 28638]|eukprot:KXN68630.1 hypothetical protein CONCODRAFT_79682 [Conidiobolus coronatus NRRL 28638]